MAQWKGLTLADGNTKAIKGFLKNVDDVVKVVKTLAQLAQGNIAFLNLLLTGLMNPLFIAIQVLAQALEDYVNSLFNTGLYYMIIDPTNVELKRTVKIGDGKAFAYPGQLLNDLLDPDFDDTVSYQVLQMVLGMEGSVDDVQKIRDAEAERRPGYLAEQQLRPYEAIARDRVNLIKSKRKQPMKPAEESDLMMRFTYNQIMDNTFLTLHFAKKYGKPAVVLIRERQGTNIDIPEAQGSQAVAGGVAIDNSSLHQNVLGQTARVLRFVSDAGMAYVGEKAGAAGLVKMTINDICIAMAKAIDDPGDFNRPGSPHFELHTDKDDAGRREERIKNINQFFFAKSQLSQFEALLARAKTLPANQRDDNLISSYQDRVKNLKTTISDLGNNKSTVIGKLGQPKKDLYGRPKLLGYNANANPDPFMEGSDGIFSSVGYNESINANLDSGFDRYSGIVFYLGFPTLDSIPIDVFEILGSVFGGGFNKAMTEAANKIVTAFNNQVLQKQIQLRNVCQVTQYKPEGTKSAFNPKMKVKEDYYRIEKGTILIGESSKNTVIVLDNMKTERESITAIDTRGNKYNPYASLTATSKTQQQSMLNTGGGGEWNVPNYENEEVFNPTTGQTTSNPTLAFQAENTKSVFSVQKLLVAPYSNVQGQGKYEPVNGKIFQDGELVYVARETEDGTIIIDQNLAGGDDISVVLGNFNNEVFTIEEYNFPPSTAPDFNGRITVGEMFPDFAFAMRAGVMSFANMLRGFAKGGSSALAEIQKMLAELIKFLKKLEDAILRFIAWFEALVVLGDSGIYFVSFSANGKAGLKSELNKLATASGAPPLSLKYSTAILFLGTEADTAGFLNTLNTNQAFRDWEAAKRDFESKFNSALERFVDDAKTEYGEVLRRGSVMESAFGEDNKRNSNTNRLGNSNPLLMNPNLISTFDQSPGSEDKFFNGQYSDEVGFEFSGLTDNMGSGGGLGEDMLGFSNAEAFDSSQDVQFFWRFSVERLTAQEELLQKINGYKLYWARVSLDENENESFEKLQEIYGFTDDTDFNVGENNDTLLEVEVRVGQGMIPEGTTHVLLVSVATVEDRLGNQTRYSDVESLEIHAIPISTGLPDAPEVVVDQASSSVSISEHFITNISFTIQDLDTTGDNGVSTVLGYRIFFADSNKKQLDVAPFLSLKKPAIDSSGTNTISGFIRNTDLKPSTFADWRYMIVFAENQNGYSAASYFDLYNITAALDMAQSAVFTDTNANRADIFGDLKINPGTHTSINGIDTVYKVFLGSRNPTTNVISQVGSQIGTDVNFRFIDINGELTAPIPTTTITPDQTHFMIFTALNKRNVPGSQVLMRSSLNIPINDLGDVPAFFPPNVAFTDVDTVNQQISGTFTIEPALDEQLIDNYTIYFGTEDFTRIDTTGRRGNGQGFITGLTLGTETTVTLADNNHQMSSGDFIEFIGVGGTTELNGNSYYAELQTDFVTLKLYTDSILQTPLDSSAFTAFTSGGRISHGVASISDDDLAELSRTVSAVDLPTEAKYYMAFAKNGFGESKQFSYDVVVDPEYPNAPGEIIEIEKDISRVIPVN